MKTNLLVDYLTMTFKVTSEQLDCFMHWLQVRISFPVHDAIKGTSQLSGYSDCLYYQGIKIHSRVNEVCLDASGSGCRMIEELNKNWDWYGFLSTFHDAITKPMKDTEANYRVHISRMDIACDLLDDERITIPFLQDYIIKNKYICKSDYHSCVIGNYEMSVYLGSPRSNRRLRIYDKALEQGEQDKKKWVRFEFQLRNESATAYYLNLRENDGNFVKVYYGMMHEYLRFITQVNDGNNFSRKSIARWWAKFLCGVQKMRQLYLPGASYGMSNISRFYNKGCASTVRALLEASGGDVTELMKTAEHTPLNKRQREAVEKYKRKIEEIQIQQESNEEQRLWDDEANDRAIKELMAARSLGSLDRMRLWQAGEDDRKYRERASHWAMGTVGSKPYQGLEPSMADQDLPFGED